MLFGQTPAHILFRKPVDVQTGKFQIGSGSAVLLPAFQGLPDNNVGVRPRAVDGGDSDNGQRATFPTLLGNQLWLQTA